MDRNGEFKSKIIKKYETVFSELNKKIISFYAKGISTSNIQRKIHSLYGIAIFPSWESFLEKCEDIHHKIE